MFRHPTRRRRPPKAETKNAVAIQQVVENDDLMGNILEFCGGVKVLAGRHLTDLLAKARVCKAWRFGVHSILGGATELELIVGQPSSWALNYLGMTCNKLEVLRGRHSTWHIARLNKGVRVLEDVGGLSTLPASELALLSMCCPNLEELSVRVRNEDIVRAWRICGRLFPKLHKFEGSIFTLESTENIHYPHHIGPSIQSLELKVGNDVIDLWYVGDAIEDSVGLRHLELSDDKKSEQQHRLSMSLVHETLETLTLSCQGFDFDDLDLPALKRVKVVAPASKRWSIWQFADLIRMPALTHISFDRMGSTGDEEDDFLYPTVEPTAEFPCIETIEIKLDSSVWAEGIIQYLVLVAGRASKITSITLQMAYPDDPWSQQTAARWSQAFEGHATLKVFNVYDESDPTHSYFKWVPSGKRV